MRVEDLSIGELVEFDSEDGVVRFAGQRALIIDATAKGNLRKELINHFGLDVSNPDSHQFLFDNMKIFFYNEGVEITQIDTSQEGKVNW